MCSSRSGPGLSGEDNCRVGISKVLESEHQLVESYQEASRVIAEQQRTITHLNEKLKVVTSLREVDNSEMQLRQRKISPKVTPSPPAPSLPPCAPAPTHPATAPAQENGGEESSQPSSLAPPAPPAPPAPLASNAPAPAPGLPAQAAASQAENSEEVGWRDAWEEVWEDNNSGELVSHQSSRLDHVCKKCDKPWIMNISSENT